MTPPEPYTARPLAPASVRQVVTAAVSPGQSGSPCRPGRARRRIAAPSPGVAVRVDGERGVKGHDRRNGRLTTMHSGREPDLHGRGERVLVGAIAELATSTLAPGLQGAVGEQGVLGGVRGPDLGDRSRNGRVAVGRPVPVSVVLRSRPKPKAPQCFTVEVTAAFAVAVDDGLWWPETPAPADRPATANRARAVTHRTALKGREVAVAACDDLFMGLCRSGGSRTDHRDGSPRVLPQAQGLPGEVPRHLIPRKSPPPSPCFRGTVTSRPPDRKGPVILPGCDLRRADSVSPAPAIPLYICGFRKGTAID